MSNNHELIVEVYLEPPNYDFYVAGVFYDPDHNAYRVATDSGCSCYSPWDNDPQESEPPQGLAEAVKAFRDCFTSYVTIDEREQAVYELTAHARQVGARK